VTIDQDPELESKWIGQVISGDSSKFQLLVEKHQNRIYATMLAMLGNRHDAEDTTQEAMIAAFRKLSLFERRSSFYTWLHRIAFNLAIDLQRKNKRSRSISMDQDFMESAKSNSESMPSPDSAASAEETICRVRMALAKLDSEQRNIIVLRDIEGLDYAEIASLNGLPLGTVRSRLHRARLELREIMKSMGMDPNRIVEAEAAK